MQSFPHLLHGCVHTLRDYCVSLRLQLLDRFIVGLDAEIIGSRHRHERVRKTKLVLNVLDLRVVLAVEQRADLESRR